MAIRGLAKMTTKFRSIVQRLKRLTSLPLVGRDLAYIFLAVMVASLFVESVTRKAIGLSLIVVDEVAGALMVLIVFLAMGWAYEEKAHLRIGFVADRLPQRASQILKLVLAFASLAFTGYVICLWWDMAFITLQSGRVLRVTNIPEWPIQMGTLLGWILLFMAILKDMVNQIRAIL